MTQHAESPRQLVLLTTHGSYLLTKLRPVDQLRHLLETERGAGGEAVEAFFRLHKVTHTHTHSHSYAHTHTIIHSHTLQETQACAMALVLATGPNQQVTYTHQYYFCIIFPSDSSLQGGQLRPTSSMAENLILSSRQLWDHPIRSLGAPPLWPHPPITLRQFK